MGNKGITSSFLTRSNNEDVTPLSSFYSNDEVKRLITAAQQLQSPLGLRDALIAQFLDYLRLESFILSSIINDSYIIQCLNRKNIQYVVDIKKILVYMKAINV